MRLPSWRDAHRTTCARINPALDRLFPLPRLSVSNEQAVADLLVVLNELAQADDRLRIDQEGKEWLAAALLANDWAWPMIRAMVVTKPSR
jgi:hypothetical protein